LVRRRHPDYDPDTLDYDYALIKLDRTHPNPYLVSLRTTPEVPVDLVIMGWGRTTDGGDQPEVMLEAQVRRFDTATCRTNYFPDPITENMFCADEDGADACQGDSGGPIVIPETNVQIGFTSWGFGCANATFPGVYARIDRGYPWIEETICSDLSPGDCTADGTLPIIDDEGVALDRTCLDRDEFLGLGKKLQIRDCDWVGARSDRRCQWYGEHYCPATCAIERCQVA
jgi:secreted trypsin-like serine protease